MQAVLALVAQVVGCRDDEVVSGAGFVVDQQGLYAGLEDSPVHVMVQFVVVGLLRDLELGDALYVEQDEVPLSEYVTGVPGISYPAV